MLALDYARKRIQAFLDELSRLRDSEFPYGNSREALERIIQAIESRGSSLQKVNPAGDSAVILNACAESLTDLYLYLPVAGFILRSTNVRNGFECYGPLLRLSRQILGDGTKLVLSSEWDYSPLVYMYPRMQDFVLLGLPAPESANPLLMAIVGHELGHPLWLHRRYENKFTGPVRDRVVREVEFRWSEYNGFYPSVSKEQLTTDIFAQRTWLSAYDWAMRQIEEIFCDFMGLRLFGEAYVRAFTFVASPCINEERLQVYPNGTSRAHYMQTAAGSLEIAVSSEIFRSFADQPEPANDLKMFLLSIADNVSNSLVSDLIDEVKRIAEEKQLPPPLTSDVDAICEDFRRVLPASGGRSISGILNAAWTCFGDPDLWKEFPQILAVGRDTVLKDLVLKSFEVLEIEHILGRTE